jgi:hypothetical protein
MPMIMEKCSQEIAQRFKTKTHEDVIDFFPFCGTRKRACVLVDVVDVRVTGVMGLCG